MTALRIKSYLIWHVMTAVSVYRKLVYLFVGVIGSWWNTSYYSYLFLLQHKNIHDGWFSKWKADCTLLRWQAILLLLD